MQDVLDKWSMVVVGNWNTSILVPPWLTKNVVGDNTEITVEIPFSNPNLPPRMSFREMYMLVFNDKLVVAPRSKQDDTLRNCADTLGKILDILFHTPISAIGMNYGWLEKTPNTKLLALFSLNDTNEITGMKGIIENTILKRKIRFADSVINMTLTKEGETINFDFNCHLELNDNKQAAQYLRSNIIECKKRCEEILKTLYQLEEKE